MLYLQTFLLKVTSTTCVTAFVLISTKPKPEEAKEYDRDNRTWKNKVKYKTGTNEVRKQELSIKRYKMFSLLSFLLVLFCLCGDAMHQSEEPKFQVPL